MRVALFEDERAGNFAPIALLRPVFDLVCGRYTLRERVQRVLQPTDWGAFLRPELAAVFREEFPAARVNSLKWLQAGATLLINGRWLPTREALQKIDPAEAGAIDGEVVYVTVGDDEGVLFDGRELAEGLDHLRGSRKVVRPGGRLLRYPWDLVDANAEQLRDDFGLISTPATPFEPGPQVAVLGPPGAVQIDPQAQVDPFVVLDARNGPITVEEGAIVQSFTRLEGPCHVGRESELFRANVRGGTTIGPVCRVGGEIEESILQGFVNKYHDGFLGHSYVCPWVNLGALTTNSDLKNDYSTVRVPLQGEAVETGSTKVGCFIGDHTKAALGSLFNTGTSVGVMCQVLPAGELLPKFIPSFSRIWRGVPDDGLDLSAALATARIAMNRRNVELTDAGERLLRRLHEQTQAERTAAVARFAARRRER